MSLLVLKTQEVETPILDIIFQSYAKTLLPSPVLPGMQSCKYGWFFLSRNAEFLPEILLTFLFNLFTECLSLYATYISNFTFRGRINNIFSNLYRILGVILQGSVFSPTLFKIFFNDIPRTHSLTTLNTWGLPLREHLSRTNSSFMEKSRRNFQISTPFLKSSCQNFTKIEDK